MNFFHGITPFYSSSNFQILEKIKKHEINQISEEIPEDAKDLIQRLLQYDPKIRIGASAKNKKIYDLKEIKSHRYFKGIDFDNLDKIDPPFKINYVCNSIIPYTNSCEKNSYSNRYRSKF